MIENEYQLMICRSGYPFPIRVVYSGRSRTDGPVTVDW